MDFGGVLFTDPGIKSHLIQSDSAYEWEAFWCQNFFAVA